MEASRLSLDEAFHAVMAELPEGWRFKGVMLSTRAGHQRKVGWWYATASGPHPDRPYDSIGLTGAGRPGFDGLGEALLALAGKLARYSAYDEQ